MFITPRDDSQLEEAAASFVERQRRAWGFVPNYAACFTSRPAVAEAWEQLSRAVRDGMDRRLYELVTIAAARARRSTYCTTAHSTFLRDTCGDEATLHALADDPTGATLEPRDRAVYAFAARVATDPATVEQADVDALREVGLGDEDITGVVMAVAARLFFTTVLDGLGAPLDARTAAAFEPALRKGMIVGRPPAPA